MICLVDFLVRSVFCLDAAFGFYQILLKDGKKPKTAFRTPFGHYQFRVLPFGLTNDTFQSVMNNLFNPPKFCADGSLNPNTKDLKTDKIIHRYPGMKAFIHGFVRPSAHSARLARIICPKADIRLDSYLLSWIRRYTSKALGSGACHCGTSTLHIVVHVTASWPLQVYRVLPVQLLPNIHTTCIYELKLTYLRHGASAHPSHDAFDKNVLKLHKSTRWIHTKRMHSSMGVWCMHINRHVFTKQLSIMTHT